MIKRSIQIVKEYNIEPFPEYVDYTGILEFDSIIYFAYLIDIGKDSLKEMGFSVKIGSADIMNKILVITNDYYDCRLRNSRLLSVWMESMFYFEPFVDDWRKKEAKGKNAFITLDFDEFIKLTNNKIFLGKCFFKEDAKNLDEEFPEISSCYSDGLFNEILRISNNKFV